MPDGTSGGGGGDSHQAVGNVTHSVFFVDLSGACVTMNVSRDLGETFVSDRLGCGASPGAIDDRQWVDTDETASTPNVYVSFNNDSDPRGASLVLVRSQHDGTVGTFVTDSPCNAFAQSFAPADDATPTACPDPSDPQLWISGAVVVDKSPTSRFQHSLYIPFARTDGTNYSLWVAVSRDEGATWTRQHVADLGPHDPANIFPDLTVDTGGNLYYTWSQNTDPDDAANLGGEQDVYYTWSTGGGTSGTWAAPIDLTGEQNDSAIFPWLVAGSPGQVDLVYYKANNGVNSNVDFADVNGNQCTEGAAGCTANRAVWNVYFAQAQNALNPGANFKSVQISDHPNHVGQICTNGLNCSGNRDLLDFFTVDVDHLGAANVTWADDNNSRHDTRDKFSRQLAGNSVFANTTINLRSSWPITDHAVTDRAGDVFDTAGNPKGSCAGMDVLGTSANRNGNLLTVSLTLNGAPTATAAVACGTGNTGGLWGAEFWASSAPDPTTGGDQNDNFYIAYRDNPGDVEQPTPGVEAGRMNSLSPTVTSEEFHRTQAGTLGGTCFTAAGTPTLTTPCTITMTTDLSTLGIKSGTGLYSITGLSVYYFGTEQRAPEVRVPIGFSQQADAATPFDINGTGTL
jgi:hypothetical protein